MATTTEVQKEENPEKTLNIRDQPSDPNPQSIEASNDSASRDADAPPKEGAGDEELKPTDGDLTAADEENCGSSATNIQKKIRRAERFGMPVQLSEQEKRNSRAERFGTGPSLNGSDTIKKSEDLKRKARAERFGLEKSAVAAEEEKKKARLARFAPVSKTDPAEEEKKKARALRFSDKSSSLTQTNGEGIEPKAAITGKAGGST